jgi:hypothetical protein
MERKTHSNGYDTQADGMTFDGYPAQVEEHKGHDSDSEAEWDLESVRLSQDFGEIIGAQQVIATVSVRPPHAQEWFRVNPDKDWQLQTAILQLKKDREYFLISPKLHVQLWDEIKPVILFAAISRQGEFFLWPIRLPRSDGKSDDFMKTDLAAAREAQQYWTRRSWVAESKSHKILRATNLPDEPNWPTEKDFEGLVKIAFKDRYISNHDHPVLKRLRGEL